MADSSRCRWLFALCVGSMAACGSDGSHTASPRLTDEEMDRAQSVPHHSTAEVGVQGAGEYDDGEFFGAVVAVKQGDDLFFTVSAHDEEGRTAIARFNLTRAEADRLYLERVLLIHPVDDWNWIYANRGTVTLQGDQTGELSAQVREFEVRLEDGGTFALTAMAVPTSRFDSVTRTIAEGEDIQLSAVGRMLGSCFTVDEDGTSRIDLSSTDPFCTGATGL